jgi:hypothetical protein
MRNKTWLIDQEKGLIQYLLTGISSFSLKIIYD